MTVEGPFVEVPPPRPPPRSAASRGARGGAGAGCVPLAVGFGVLGLIVAAVALVSLNRADDAAEQPRSTTSWTLPTTIRPPGMSRACQAAWDAYGGAYFDLVNEIEPFETQTLTECRSVSEWLIGVRPAIVGGVDPEERATDLETLDAWCAKQVGDTRVCATRRSSGSTTTTTPG